MYQNEPGVTLADLNDQYGDVLSKLDIASKDIPQPSRTIGTPATPASAAQSTILGRDGKPLLKTS